MKTVKRVLLVLAVLVVLIVLAGLFFLKNLQNSAIPDYNKEVKLGGVSVEVTVLRDESGIPHISAANEKDLYTAVGFAMAQDRLWQMDLLRRVTQGRLSEVLGKDQAETDLLMRALRIEEKSEKILAGTSPEILESLEAFAAGVNQYMAYYPLPPEFKILGYHPEPWKPVHSVNLIGYMAWDLSSGWEIEMVLNQLSKVVSPGQLNELIPDIKSMKTAVYPDYSLATVKPEDILLSASDNMEKLGVEVFSGSNNWAVSGKKSTTGRPLLANDMHLGLFAPGIWYQMHQHVEGKLNVTGLVLPGQPFVIAGHNDSVAWGMTNVMVDDIDFYAEKLNEDSTKYLLDGEWKDLLIKNEIIKTKEGETIERKLRFTHRGPIVNQFKKKAEVALSVHWVGNEMSNEIGGVYLLNRAKNWTDFREAARNFVSVSQNIVYADVNGNIGLQCSAGIPVRTGDGIQIYPGDSSKYDWKGLVPFEELPFEYNPERGYVSSANNKTVSDDYPYIVSHWFATTDRIDRIRELLESKEQLNADDFAAIQADVKSKKAEQITPVFVAAIKSAQNLNETEKAVFATFEKWDYQLTAESPAVAVFEVLYRKVCENLVSDELTPELLKAIKGQKMLLENLLINIQNSNNSEWIDDKNTPEKEVFSDIIIKSYKETIVDLTKELGNDTEKWQWGKLHTFIISHPLGTVKMLDRAFHLNRGPFEMKGSFHTVGPYSYSYNNLYAVNHGASHRHIFDTGDWDASKTVIPTGTSGIPASPFYLDQTEMYLNNQYHADPFSKEEVEKAAKFRMKVVPK